MEGKNNTNFIKNNGLICISSYTYIQLFLLIIKFNAINLSLLNNIYQLMLLIIKFNNINLLLLHFKNN